MGRGGGETDNSQLTTHKVVDDRVDGRVEVGQPVTDQVLNDDMLVARGTNTEISEKEEQMKRWFSTISF